MGGSANLHSCQTSLLISNLGGALGGAKAFALQDILLHVTFSICNQRRAVTATGGSRALAVAVEFGGVLGGAKAFAFQDILLDATFFMCNQRRAVTATGGSRALAVAVEFGRVLG